MNDLWLFGVVVIIYCNSATWAIACCCGDDCETEPCPATATLTPACPPPLPYPVTPSPEQSEILNALYKPAEPSQTYECLESECPPPESCEPCPECPLPPSPEPCPECPLPPPPPPCVSLPCQDPVVPPCSVRFLRISFTRNFNTPRLTFASNDCCHGCPDGCYVNYRRRFRNRARFHKKVRKSKRYSRHIREITVDDDPTCNNYALRRLMISNMNDDVTKIKRVIQKLAENEFGQNFNVICSTGSFAYIVHSNIYCQASINDIHCYAFSF
uniref:Ground-like domain-containing protein n=1 Tax=Syphacia muris TaxID=451379 RepID=A0A0N5AR74_9BILA